MKKCFIAMAVFLTLLFSLEIVYSANPCPNVKCPKKTRKEKIADPANCGYDKLGTQKDAIYNITTEVDPATCKCKEKWTFEKCVNP